MLRDPNQVDPALNVMIASLVDGQASWPILLHGPVGTGKTCAALCLCDNVPRAAYFTASELHQAVMDSQFNRLTWRNFHWLEAEPDALSKTVYANDLWKYLRRVPLLVIDELGRGNVTPSHLESVYRAVDERNGRPLVGISNHSPEALDSIYDAPTVSRLCAGTVYELTGNDRRLN